MSNLAILESRLRADLDEVNGQLAVKRALQKQLETLQNTLSTLEAEISNTEEAAVVIGAVETAQQDQLKKKLERLVSYALTVIFERPYRFVVEFDQRGHQTDVTFKVEDEFGNTQSVKDAHGGGILVVVAYILRAIVMMSAQPKLLPIMIDDEPFVQVSSEYRDRLVEFLQRFAESADVQLLLVTHNQELQDIGDRRYRFTLVRGKTHVEDISPTEGSD